MFTLPPWPPKDYVLKNVGKGYQSSSEFTPIAFPRVTQSNLARYLVPVEYKEAEKVELDLKPIHPKIIEGWGEKARAWWVDAPGKNAYFLHQLHKDCKFDTEVNNNPIFQHKEKVFNRSFTYELDCIEFRRLKKLQEKSDAECNAKCRMIKAIEEAKRLKRQEQDSIKVTPCKWQSPFWWEYSSADGDKDENEIQIDTINQAEGNSQDCSFKSWQETPKFFSDTDDPCQRREELLKVGLPFRNERCNWYYKNYPPPKLELKPQKFSK